MYVWYWYIHECSVIRNKSIFPKYNGHTVQTPSQTQYTHHTRYSRVTREGDLKKESRERERECRWMTHWKSPVVRIKLKRKLYNSYSTRDMRPRKEKKSVIIINEELKFESAGPSPFPVLMISPIRQFECKFFWYVFRILLHACWVQRKAKLTAFNQYGF